MFFAKILFALKIENAQPIHSLSPIENYIKTCLQKTLNTQNKKALLKYLCQFSLPKTALYNNPTDIEAPLQTNKIPIHFFRRYATPLTIQLRTTKF